MVLGSSNLAYLIANCSDVILILDKLEEQRPLFIQEKNMRKIIKNHMAKLLKYKNNYWRQRYTERWVVLGDECTKFFHATATNRFRKIILTSCIGMPLVPLPLWKGVIVSPWRS
jgi:3-methyladenine DNA glycosylase AlkC